MHKQMRHYRLRANLTLEELSKRSGVSTSTIQHWEHGDGLLTLANMAAVCEVLGISIDEYIGHAIPKALKVYAEELNRVLDCAEEIAHICEKVKGDKQ